MSDYKERLRRLALCDAGLVATGLAEHSSGLDPKTYALVRLSTTVAVDANQSSYQQVVERALAAGATTEEIVGTVIAVMSLTGVPRAVAAAPKVGLALGYDVDAALEG
jgi:4-carboxymuconolactone decarboxylase